MKQLMLLFFASQSQYPACRSRLLLECSSRFSFSLTDDSKLPAPPTLEPTGPAPSLSEQESPSDPPTLKPISDSKPSSRSLKSRKVEEEELLEKPALQLGSEPLQCLLSDNGVDRLSLINPDSPPGTPLGGVGRRTSVLFKKARNGVKLPRSPDGTLEDGEDSGTVGSPASPASTEDEHCSRKRPRSGSCSDSEGERSPQQEEETGDPACDFFCCFQSTFLLCLARGIFPCQLSPGASVRKHFRAVVSEGWVDIGLSPALRGMYNLMC